MACPNDWSSAVPTSKMAPGLSGAPHWKIVRGDIVSTPSCILSIIQLTLLPKLSVLEQMSPAGKLWLATMEYLATIPGCTATYWGTQSGHGKQDEEENGKICLLIHWESAMHWAKFQESFGLLMMREVLTEKMGLVNRCARIAELPSVAGKEMLELCSFLLKSDEFTRDSSRFEEEWIKWRDEREQEGKTWFGGWLEEDGAWPTPRLMLDRQEELDRVQDALRKSQDRIFIMIKFEGAPVEESQGKSSAPPVLAGHTATINTFSIALALAPTSKHSPQTTELTSAHSNLSIDAPLARKIKINWFSQLLQVSPRRCYSEKTGMFHNVDQIQERSVKESLAKPKLRLYPGPRGEMTTKMGDLNQYGARYEDRMPRVLESVVEILYLKIKRCLFEPDSEASKLFLDFRWHIRELEGCSALLWARDDDRNDEFVVVIYWMSAEARATNAHFVQDTTWEFIAASESLTKGTPLSGLKQQDDAKAEQPKYPPSLRLRQSRRGLSSLRDPMLLCEITTFEVQDTPHVKGLVEKFYGGFQMTSSLNARVVGQYIPLACNTQTYFFSPSLVPGKIKFTSVIRWCSEAAMGEWYSDFASCEQYERLGHKIDALRCLGPENVETRLLNLTIDEPGTRKTEMSAREQTEAAETARRRREKQALAKNGKEKDVGRGGFGARRGSEEFKAWYKAGSST